jgi:hypothetical protein
MYEDAGRDLEGAQICFRIYPLLTEFYVSFLLEKKLSELPVPKLFYWYTDTVPYHNEKGHIYELVCVYAVNERFFD